MLERIVTETENAEKAQYTDKRLLKTVMQNQDQSAGSLIETIASDVKAHVGNTAQNDDITIDDNRIIVIAILRDKGL